MKKTYKAKPLRFTVAVTVGGKRKMVSFKNDGSNNGSYYSTENEEEQKCLESHFMFGNMFSLDSEEEVVDGNSGNGGSELTEKEFKSVNEAKEFFTSDPYKIAVSKLATRDAVKEQGKLLGFDVKFEGEE